MLSFSISKQTNKNVVDTTFKKEVNVEVYFWHADKHQSFLQVTVSVHSHTCLKVLKIRSLHVFAMSPDKHGR